MTRVNKHSLQAPNATFGAVASLLRSSANFCPTSIASPSNATFNAFADRLERHTSLITAHRKHHSGFLGEYAVSDQILEAAVRRSEGERG